MWAFPRAFAVHLSIVCGAHPGEIEVQVGVHVDAAGHDHEAPRVDLTPVGRQACGHGGDPPAGDAEIGHDGVGGGPDEAAANHEVVHEFEGGLDGPPRGSPQDSVAPAKPALGRWFAGTRLMDTTWSSS